MKHLDESRRHLARAEESIVAQRELIDRMAADGHNTTLARQVLETFEKTLAAMREHLAIEEAEAAKRSPGAPGADG